MKANELRIGNYFSFGKHKEITTVFKITFERKDGYLINGQIPESHCEPIPLTEKWLLKLGFSKMTIKPLWRKTIGEYTLDSDDFLFSFESKYVYVDSGLALHPIGNEIEYVHQLQNLYFALTGEELTLNSQAIQKAQ